MSSDSANSQLGAALMCCLFEPSQITAGRSVVAGLGHYKNRAEKPRTADSSVGGGGSSGVLNTTRLEGQTGCKTERLQALSTPLGPFDKNYSRKRLREHSLDRTDCEWGAGFTL